MRVRLTERGRRIAEELNIPKEARIAFYSLFPKTSEIDKVILHYGGGTHDVSMCDEECVEILCFYQDLRHI